MRICLFKLCPKMGKSSTLQDEMGAMVTAAFEVWAR